jgi:predicted AAA+ superfamily ATPase
MFWERNLSAAFRSVREQFPAVLITGPRQSGKTTFLQHAAADAAYVSFDDPLSRQFATADPNGFLDQFGDRPVVLDEVQYVPELFSYLKLRIDARRQVRGRFLMSGSQQFELMKHLSDSLAGRVALLELLPFSAAEVLANQDLDLPELLWRGGYPSVVLQPEVREAWLNSYLHTYVERDVRQLQAVRDLRTFEVFLGLCAARHGQELNLAEVGRHAGVAQPTCKAWLSVLEASYVVALLPPYHRNLGKRLVKAPKLYFLDSALAVHLTRQPSAEALWRGAMGDAFGEGWAVIEARKAFAEAGRPPGLYYWRSHDGLEVDLLVESDGKLIPVEVKQTATPLPGHAAGLSRLAELLGPEGGAPLLVCRVAAKAALPGGVTALPWREFPAWLRQVVRRGSGQRDTC